MDEFSAGKGVEERAVKKHYEVEVYLWEKINGLFSWKKRHSSLIWKHFVAPVIMVTDRLFVLHCLYFCQIPTQLNANKSIISYWFLTVTLQM